MKLLPTPWTISDLIKGASGGLSVFSVLWLVLWIMNPSAFAGWYGLTILVVHATAIVVYGSFFFGGRLTRGGGARQASDRAY